MDSRETILASLKLAVEKAGTKEEKYRALYAYAEFQKDYLVEKHNICERLTKESSTDIQKKLIAQGMSEQMAKDLVGRAKNQNVKRLIESGEIFEELNKTSGTEGLWTIGVGIVIVLFALGLGLLFSFFSEDSARASGSQHYSVFLPTGAFVAGIICIFRGLYKFLSD